ncbi:hypothetical protein [Sphingomicrobium lutaoense]|uniref:Uncharacterized protein n=1 Tax=Sphingomicrobium lutaoense TaxID=515949 RepID=A0A839YVC1_9SPHN|nr:hypothetical protein [Sphingomicrobium lutaoense]MBB3764161.1 hypothetical protein [Sphingomicrobium lutaoense]
MATKKKKEVGDAVADAGTAEEVKPKKAKKTKKAKKEKKKAKKEKKVRVAVAIEEETEGTSEKKGKKGKIKEEGLDALGKLADHPLVADLVAAGAVAAVGALAEKKVTSARGKSTGSKEALKLAGAAAAAAIGKRLMAEFEEAKARREESDDDEN